jgi:hypothetical protein
MREKYYNSFANFRERKILEEKNRYYKKILKKFLKILIINRKFRKRLVIFRANLVRDWKIVRF